MPPCAPGGTSGSTRERGSGRSTSTSAPTWPRANGQRLNVGASPGDGFHDAPYLYVAPWDADRPGDPEYWNAPFGAVLGYDEVRTAPDALAVATEFVETGFARFA